MNASLVRSACFLCGGPAEHVTLPASRLVEPEQLIHGAAVCARCFVESEDR